MKNVLSWKKFCGEKKLLVEKFSFTNLFPTKNFFLSRNILSTKKNSLKTIIW